MRTLVVQAHPLDESYNAALLERVQAGLTSAGADHRVLRLATGREPDDQALAHVERLVLVYPTWWGGLPAVLLDWVQTMVRQGALRHVSDIQVVTTHGSSRLVNFVQGAWGRHYLRTVVAESCAPGTEVGWHSLYKIDRCSRAELARFLDRTEELIEAGSLSG